MKLYQVVAILVGCAVLASSQMASADIGEVQRLQAQLVNGKRKVDLQSRLKTEHGLSASEVAKYQEQGLDDRQLTIAARFAKASGISLAGIVKMRLQEKKGWGEIAKTLGVDPSEIGLRINRKVRYEYRMRNAENLPEGADRT